MHSLSRAARTHIHGGVDLSNSFILCGELIDLHAITDQLTHDLDLQLVQFAPVHSIRLRNDGDDVHLYGNIKKKRKVNMRKNDGWRNVTVEVTAWSPCCLVSSSWQDRGTSGNARSGRWNTSRRGFWCHGNWTRSVLSWALLQGTFQTGYRCIQQWV